MTQDWESLVLRGIEIRLKGDSVNWELGDLALQVETAYGDHTLETYAEDIGVNFRSLQEYRRVAAAFEKSSRLENLSWTHHQAAASWPNPDQWLTYAQERRWSVRQMEDARTRTLVDPTSVTNPEADAFVERVSQSVSTKRQMLEDLLSDPEVTNDPEAQQSVVEHMVKPAYEGSGHNPDDPYKHIRAEIVTVQAERRERDDMRTRQLDSQSPFIQELDQYQARLHLQGACRKFATDGNKLLTQLGPVLSEGARYSLEEALAYADETCAAIHRYLELDGAELEEFLRSILNKEDETND